MMVKCTQEKESRMEGRSGTRRKGEGRSGKRKGKTVKNTEKGSEWKRMDKTGREIWCGKMNKSGG